MADVTSQHTIAEMDKAIAAVISDTGGANPATSDNTFAAAATIPYWESGPKFGTVAGLFASPQAIGGTTPAAGAFTTLSATGVVTVSAGAVGAPAIIPTGDTNTGTWFPAADTIAWSTGGSERVRIDSSGNLLLGATATSSNAQLYATKTYSAASGVVRGAYLQYAQSAATSGTIYAVTSELSASHTSGTVAAAIAHRVYAQASGSGGTTTELVVFSIGGSVVSGATATSAKGLRIETIGAAGTITDLRAISQESALAYNYLAGALRIGTTSASAQLVSEATTEQLRLNYNASNYASFTVSSGGDLTIAPSGGDTSITGNLGVGIAAPPVRLSVVNNSAGALVAGLLLSNPNSVSVNTGIGLYFDPNGASGSSASTTRAASIVSRQTTSGNYADFGFFTVNNGTPEEHLTIGATGNLLLGGTTAITTGTKSLGIFTGTAPTAVAADSIALYSRDLSAGNTIPAIWTEGTGIYAAGTPAAATGSIAMAVNGTVYHFTVSTTAAS